MKRLNKEEFANELKSRMEQETGLLVEIIETLSTNVKSTKLRFVRNDDERLAPVVSIDNVYKEYSEGKAHFEDIVKAVREVVADAVESVPESLLSSKIKYNSVNEGIFFCIINTEMNKKLLETLPHRNIADLSIIYKWKMGNVSDDIFTTDITNDMMKSWGKTEEDLYKIAYDNTAKLFPTTIRTMEEALNSLGIDEEIDIPEERQMYVITNEAGFYGAASILYIDKLRELANKFNSDLYILPSSIHECIAISKNCIKVDELAEMVKTVNETEVDLPDLLSNNVYHFHRKTGLITIAC